MEARTLPSKYQPRTFVTVDLQESGKVKDCRVEAVTFEGDKVYYDLSVRCGKSNFTELQHVDSAFVVDHAGASNATSSVKEDFAGPEMPDSIAIKQPAGARQDGFRPVYFNVKDMTEQQAMEYADWMREAFVSHWHASK